LITFWFDILKFTAELLIVFAVNSDYIEVFKVSTIILVLGVTGRT